MNFFVVFTKLKISCVNLPNYRQWISCENWFCGLSKFHSLDFNWFLIEKCIELNENQWRNHRRMNDETAPLKPLIYPCVHRRRKKVNPNVITHRDSLSLLLCLAFIIFIVFFSSLIKISFTGNFFLISFSAVDKLVRACRGFKAIIQLDFLFRLNSNDKQTSERKQPGKIRNKFSLSKMAK